MRVLLAPIALIGFVMIAGVLGVAGGMQQQPASAATGWGVSPLARKDIPARYLALYQQAGRQYGLDWAILAAIGKIETNHGRLQAPGVTSGANAYGCCGGPMQFYFVPYPGRIRNNETNSSTWGAYGTDGNGDGWKNVWDPADAIPAAARYLKASGAPGDYRAAIFAYNHADWYVADVLRQADAYRGAWQGGAGGGPVTGTAQQLLAGGSGVILTPGQRQDILSGGIDERLIASLVWAGKNYRPVVITALRHDHAPGTNHEMGRAADIGIVRGQVCAENWLAPSRTSACSQLALAYGRVQGPMKSTELIWCFDPDGPAPGGFARSDHCDHIHLGWDG